MLNKKTSNNKISSEKKFSESIFREEELRSIIKDLSNLKFQKKAIISLGEIIEDIGYSIVKIALSLNPENELTSDLVVRAAKRHASLSVPMIHYLWIINSNGAALFSKSYSGLQFPDTIFAGLLLGIVNMIQEVSGRDLERLVIGDLSIYIQEVPPIACAVISDDSKGIPSLVKELGKEFLRIYGHRISEPAVDVNVFTTFEKHARTIIRNWGIVKLPTDAAGDAVAKLLDPEMIRHGVISAAQRKDLKNAMKELKEIPIFHEDENNTSFEKLIDSSFSQERMRPNFVDSDKSGKDLIKEIFSAVNKLKASSEHDEETDDEFSNEDSN
ncbi:MAG: hypothetical protein HeimC3_38780 [Candidatus Heimdallarchaeota archaeon LC_3]|nr:MAG: hypothetical protein HeimC3_38780 [Candidatus Heimdallarchaeota archaeon LC_3]